MRTGDGRPGPQYWQQRADYSIQAALDPSSNLLTGAETIHYTNHSPTSLPYLWLQLEQNMCAPGSVTNQLDQPPLVFLGSEFDFSCKGFSGGLSLTRLRSGGQDLAHTIYGTMMRVELPSAARRRAVPSTWKSAGRSRSPPTAAGGWGTMVRCMNWGSGTPGWWCTTTSGAGTTSPTSAPGSSTWSTAAST